MPRCPECPYTFVKPSRFRWFELPLAIVFVRPFRCNCCQGRFFGRFSPIAWLRYRRAVKLQQPEAAE